MANGIRINVGASFDAKDIRRARREIDGLEDELNGLDKSMMRASRAAGSFGQAMTGIGSVMTQSITVPMIGAGVAATNLAASFSESMSRIVGLVGLSSEQVQAMEADVLSLAGETAKAPQELADALFVVTSAGLRGADAMEALELAAKAGAAGLGVTNDIARAVAGAMNGYGAETLDAARATDVLVATARAGNFETSQFAGALGRVLPFASQAGVTIEDLGGAVALLTRTNGNATQSINLLRALFGKFVIPTEQTRAVLAEVGVEMADIREIIQRDGLVAALRALERAVGGNREQLGRLLSSEEAAAAAFEILNADANTLTATFGETAQAAGLTAEAFGVAADQPAFQFRRALTELNVAAVELGASFLPIATRLARRVTEIADAFRDLSPQQQDFLIKAGLFVAAIGPVLTGLGLLSLAVQGVTLALAKMSIASVIATGGIAAVGAAIGIAALRSHFAELGIIGMNDEMINTRQEARDAANEMELFDRKLVNTTRAANDAELALLNLRSEMALAALDPDTGSTPEARSARAAINQQERERVLRLREQQEEEKRLREEIEKREAEMREATEAAEADAEAITAATEANVALTDSMRDSLRSINEQNVGVSDARDRIAQFSRELLAAGSITDGVSRAAERLAQVVRRDIDNALAEGNRRLDEAKAKFNAYRDAIAQGITRGNTLSDAVSEQTTALQNLTAAEEAYQRAKEEGDEEAIAKAAKDLEAAKDGEKSFLEFLEVGVTTAEGFAAQIDALRESGASLEVVQQIAELGARTGSRVASELLEGGRRAIEQANAMVKAVEAASRRAGEGAARQFFGAGVDAARQFVKAVEATIPELQSVLDRIADMIEAALGTRPNVSLTGEERFITPPPSGGGGDGRNALGNIPFKPDPTKALPELPGELRWGSGGLPYIPGLADGGLVTQPTLAMIGEAGPEVAIPLDRLGGMGATINVTVTSADPQAVVEAIRRYTRNNGPLSQVVSV